MIQRSIAKKHRFHFVMIAPLVAYTLIFTLGPVMWTVIMSFQDRFTRAFPTLANYRYILSHFQFKEAVANTLSITLIGLTLELAVGLFVALLLTKRFVGKGVVRALVILPLGVPTIVAAANMRYLFDTQGFINEILHRLHVIGVPIDWASGGLRTIVMIAVSDAWKVTPLVTLVLLAGLESIPRDIMEAARVDGASPGQIFRAITLPLLKPFITIALIIRGIDAFRLFELPITLVGTRTPVLATYAYYEYFQYNNPYTSAASAVILTVIILASAILYFKVSGRSEALHEL